MQVSANGTRPRIGSAHLECINLLLLAPSELYTDAYLRAAALGVHDRARGGSGPRGRTGCGRAGACPPRGPQPSASAARPGSVRGQRRAWERWQQPRLSPPCGPERCMLDPRRVARFFNSERTWNAASIISGQVGLALLTHPRKAGAICRMKSGVAGKPRSALGLSVAWARSFTGREAWFSQLLSSAAGREPALAIVSTIGR